MISRNLKGDTIVEVMIAIVILGAALGTVFAVSGSSQKQTQVNHERTQAQLLANDTADQIVRDYNSKDISLESYVSGLANNFCFEQNTANVNTTPPCVYNTGPDYEVTIQKDSGNRVFLITVEWDSLIGSTRDRVQLYYGI